MNGVFKTDFTNDSNKINPLLSTVLYLSRTVLGNYMIHILTYLYLPWIFMSASHLNKEKIQKALTVMDLDVKILKNIAT